MTGSEIRDLPTLRSWLNGLTDHPLQWFFEPRRDLRPGVVWAWWRDPILIAVEETLVALERVQPLGLGQKRREFRTVKGKNNTGMGALDPQLSELVVGSLLAEAGVPFRYNTSAGPDLLIGRDEVRFAIEIGARRPRSLHELSRRLTAGLRDRGLPSSVSISTDPFPPVAIRTSVLNAILEKFLPSDGSPGVTSLRTIAAPGRPHLGIPDSWVTIHVGGGRIMTQAPWNSPHMNALALEVATAVLREKRKVVQARTWPTILIADLTGGDLPDIRYWNNVFDDLWQADDEYLMVAAMTRLTHAECRPWRSRSTHTRTRPQSSRPRRSSTQFQASTTLAAGSPETNAGSNRTPRLRGMRRLLVMRIAQGPFPMETTYTWTAVDDTHTRMALRNRGEPAGFGRIAAPAMAAVMRRANRKDLNNLKKIIERQPAR